MVDAAYELSPQVLKGHYIEAVMVDLDDTLVASGDMTLKKAYYDWIVSLKKAGIPVLILSNGTKKRVAYWTQELGISGFALSGKPFLGFKRALKQLGKPAAKTAMIGDQLFTDVLGAKLAGMQSVWVMPLSAKGLLHTRLLRKLETSLRQRFISKDLS